MKSVHIRVIYIFLIPIQGTLQTSTISAMHLSSSIRSLLLLVTSIAAAIPTNTTFATECKTCPYSLCPNKGAYGGRFINITINCWTEGTSIVNDTCVHSSPDTFVVANIDLDSTWLKTTDGCYVAQNDVEWSGDGIFL
jgi:hypothetical protein